MVFKGKKIAISGGLGSIGSEIAKKSLEAGAESVLILDNRETEMMHAMYECVDENVSFLFCDVREYERVHEVLKEVDIVFHAAALKHVVVCELNPFEAVKTNIIGTQNVIKACLTNGVEKMILISTDKAVNPTNVMGATKLVAERLVAATCNIRHEQDTKFGIVRFGNVLYSRGSVLEIWDRQISKGKKITVTDPNMTRFIMDTSQCVDLIFNATEYANNGETFILKMPSVRIGDLAEAYLELRGYPNDFYEVIGARPGEKLHEELIFRDEAPFLLENDKFLLRLPLKLKNTDIRYYYKLGFDRSKRTSFSSGDPINLLTKDKVKEVLSKFLYRQKP